MSSAALDIPAFLYAQQGDAPAPLVYTVNTGGAIQPTASTATFDGTGAGGNFLACLSFYAQSGELLSRVFPQTIIQAGDVAQVSYAPFPGGMTGSGAQSGIRFDVNNIGDWLNVHTTGDPGITFTADTSAAGGIILQTNDGDNGLFFLTKANDTGGTLTRDEGSGGVKTQVLGNGGYAVQNEGNGGTSVSDDGGGGLLLSTAGNSSYTSTGTTTINSSGVLDLFSPAGINVVDLAAGGVRLASVSGGILIQTAAGGPGTSIEGGSPIILNSDTSGATNTSTIQMRIDGTTNSFSVLNLAASQVYFNVRSDGRISMPLLPTSAAGLSSGDLWNNSGVVNIV